VEPLLAIDGWPAEHVAAGVSGGAEKVHGDRSHVFSWASVTKLLTGLTLLVAVEEGTVDLDEPAGPNPCR
jgi:CubicO group peptidase (beta-lactamase class C family)